MNKTSLYFAFIVLLMLGTLVPVKAVWALEAETRASITLSQPVYFLSPDGSPVLADSGEYGVEAADEWLRLTPGTERRDALLVEAQKGTHQDTVDHPKALSIPGNEMNEADMHVVQLLNPDGSSLMAIGTYSGIRSRGLPENFLNAIEALRAKSSNRNCTPDFQFLDEDSKPGKAYSTDKTPQAWITTATQDWMGKLPDNTKLNLISIPGTHDTGAQGEHGGIGVKTQPWSITEQLNAGIRYLDIRTRRTKDSFAIHHGDYFLDMMFGDVMNEVTSFLKNHPQEVVLMRIKKDEKSAEPGSASFMEIWKRYIGIYGQYVYTRNNTVPTLGEARGKIVVLRNQWDPITVAGMISSGLQTGVEYSDQNIQDKYKVYALAHKHNKGDSVSLPSKKDVIKAYIAVALSLPATNGKLVLNHLSGAVGMVPKDVADSTNPDAYQFIGPYGGVSKNLGVLIMDYPGEKLVYRIIKSNFVSSCSCQPRTFRTVSNKTWAEFRLPTKPVGTVLSIDGGAYNKYVFPKCNRVHWSDLNFACDAIGTWVKTMGSWGADALCQGSKGNSPYVAVGNR
ncbi:MAG: phosphatidylinositol-specific phospholipase C [Nitrospirota bacterium]|nr:phosphatidylinositol-specific phospholipase C [Nitrospirota bacterium]